MDINSYVAQKTPLFLRHKIKEEGFIELFNLEKEMCRVDVSIKYVETASFFPEHVFIRGENKHYILWDINYWVLFNWFMEDYNDFLYMRKEGLERASNHFSRTFMFYLSQMMSDIPSMSFVCALECLKFFNLSDFTTEDLDSVMDLKKQIDDKNNRISYFSKMFSFHHELTHVIMSNNSDKKIEIQDVTTSVVKILKENLHEFTSDSNKNEMDKLLDLMLEGKSTKIIEEVQCDFHAFINASNLLFALHPDENKSDLLIEFMESFCLSSMFQNYLRSLHVFWRAYYKSIKNAANEKEFSIAFAEVGKEVSYQAQMSHLRNSVVLHLAEIFSGIRHGLVKRPNPIYNCRAYRDVMVPTIDKLIEVEYMVHLVYKAIDVEKVSSSVKSIQEAAKLVISSMYLLRNGDL